MFKKKRALKYPVNVAISAAGTGTAAKSGVITWNSSTGKCYLTLSSGTNIGTLVATVMGA
jgi:hypothetical protein